MGNHVSLSHVTLSTSIIGFTMYSVTIPFEVIFVVVVVFYVLEGSFVYFFICLSIIHIFIYPLILPASHLFHGARRYLLNHVRENIAFCVSQTSGSLHVYRNLQRNEFINCPLKDLSIPYHLPMSPQSFNSSEPHLLNMDILFIEISYFYWWPKQCL